MARRRERLPARLWRRFWARAPRRLQVTTAGRLLLALALACGLLALNSGNNLLFFVWGMQLGAIVVSGLLSEATLRPLQCTAALPAEARVGEVAYVRLQLRNASRWLPVFAVQTVVRVRQAADADAEATAGAARTANAGGAAEPTEAWAPYELRLGAGQTRLQHAALTPAQRGACTLTRLVARTAYPFGLFVKDRRFAVPTTRLWIWPARLPVDDLVQAVARSVGEAPLARAGVGEDFFALRSYRLGDPPARVLWRRAAGGRGLLVREQEAVQGQRVILVLRLAASQLHRPAPVAGFASLGEYTVALVGSLAEALVARGWEVGLHTHGHHVAADDVASAGRRRHLLLDALAQLVLTTPLPPLPPAPAAAPTALGLAPTLQLTGLAASGEGAAGPQLALTLAGARPGPRFAGAPAGVAPGAAPVAAPPGGPA